MPLLKKKPFEKVSLSDFPNDDELVYYCEITQEIFRDYEQFCDRIILCNSMVWSCSMTGKSGLTYKEALESEENARKNLKDFPPHLKVPILFLAMRTKRTAVGDMVDDVFTFVKDRYFIGENVEASFSGSRWKESHILQVVGPTEEQIKKLQNNGQNPDKIIPASHYRYEVEQLDAEDEDISEIIVVDHEHIRRKKGVYTRDKNKLFLKYHVEQNSNGIWVVKDSSIKEYDLKKVRFDQIFDGPAPDFTSSSKKSAKNIEGGKKQKQETLAKFLTKNNIVQKKSDNKNNNNNILEIMKQRELEFKKMKEDMKQKKAEEKLAERQRRREENIKISLILRDWYKPKDDLELEDHKKLPVPTTIESKLPDKYLGDVFMALEFANSFGKQLYTKNFFPSGLTFELMERALLDKEVAGPLIDLIQMLLTAIFNLQDEEASQYKTEVENTSEVKDKDWQENLSLSTATTLATVASKWSVKYQGLPLGRLPLYSLTTSEILRLHLLSSGARINENGAKWRYLQRGGYTSEDDPALHLRLHHPHILKALAFNSVTQLPVGDKLKIINCLINQVLTYAEIRDIVEERLEKSRQAKMDLKSVQAAERRREQEYMAEIVKIKREGKENNRDITNDLDKLEKEAERKKGEYQKKVKKLTKQYLEYQIFLGYDRAYRRYLKFESIPGLFIEFNEENPGQCLSHIVPQNPNLIDADRTKTLLHLRQVHNELNMSDKENNPQQIKVNGFHDSVLNQDVDMCKELLLCSADPTTCIVHSPTIKKQRWGFYHTEEQLNALLVALNRRGIRESELFQVLQTQKDHLADLIAQTPVVQFNRTVEVEETEQRNANKLRSQKKSKYEDANLGYPMTMQTAEVLEAALVDNILEMEEKIHAGNLGVLRVKDREAWRSHLQNREFEKMDKTIVKKNGFQKGKEKKEDEGSRSNTPEPTKEYCDPGKFLGPTLDIESEDSDEGGEEVLLCPTTKMRLSVEHLAIALAQVAHSVDLRYLKKPLGHADLKNTDTRKKDFDILDQWEQSLLASTSYSQIFLHYGTLDSCVMWSRSALLARCRICRRQKDSENMLLCDNCNYGHHLYCLKPKLTSIPQGDWFCDRCLREKEKEEKKKKEEEEKPQRQRALFKDEEAPDEEEEHEESIDEEQDEEEDEDDDEEEDNKEEEHVKDEETSDENDEEDVEGSEPESEDIKVNGHVVIEVCEACNSGGELLCCDHCPAMYHLECVDPPLRRVPRGQWFCNKCKKKRRSDDVVDYANGRAVQPTATSLRRCAEKARHMIHGFAKTLRRISDSTSESDGESDSDSDDIPLSRRSNRRETDSREDLPLHNVALQELLSEILRHDDAWAFIAPVKKNEVPDYYDIITKPMDFGTIKYKLNMGEYKCDAELMADAILIFENCNTYNDSDSEVAKCGKRLLRFFVKRARELGLRLPKEMRHEEEEEHAEEEDRPPTAKKRRMK